MEIQKEFEAVAVTLPAFQTYFKIKGVETTELFSKRANGEYVYTDVRINFEIWQAAKADANKNLKPIIKNLNNIKASDFRENCYDYDKGWRDCAVTVLNDLEAQELSDK